jgi:Bacterial Ig domain
VQSTLPIPVRRHRSLPALAVLVAAAMGMLSLPFIPTPASAATASFKQANAKEIRSGKVNRVPFDKANKAGNLIVVYVAWTNTNSVTITDTRRNAYRPVEKNPKEWGSNRSSQVFYAENIAGGSNTVQGTFSEAIKSAGWAAIYVHEYAGIEKADPLDVSVSSAGVTDMMSSGLMETKNANDLIFGAGAAAGGINQEGSGFTSRSTEFGNLTEDKSVTTVASYDATATQRVGSNPWVMHMVAFKVDVNAPDTESPSPPTGVSQVPKSTSQIDLTWAPSTDNVAVTDYKVYRDGTQVGTANTTSYSDTGLAPLTTYGYAVSAVDAAGNDSPKSAVVKATTIADTTAPAVSLTAPTDGATISDTTTLTAIASDDVAVVGLQFLLDGKPLGPEIMKPPYAYSWNTATASSGPHNLSVRARDAANHITTSAEAKITVAGPDKSPPTVAITLPANNAQVADIVTINADVSDNIGVIGVQFLVDGVNSGQEDTSAPYSLAWDSHAVQNGPHTISARARDAAGNSTPSAVITVNVANNTSQCSVTAGTATTAIIRSPDKDRLFTAGQVITLNGGADPDCGTLPDTAFSWTIDLVKDGQVVQSNSISGMKNSAFTVPSSGSVFEGNAHYRITLNVNDGKSQSTTFVTMDPQKVNLSFNTAPAGLILNFDGTDKPTPFAVDTLVGSRHSVEARDQTSGGVSYTFQSWSDGKAQRHDIVTPTAAQNYIATYTITPSKPVQPGTITFRQQNYSIAQTNQSTAVTEYSKPQTEGSTNLVAIGWRSAAGTTLSVTDSAGNKYDPAVQLVQPQGNLSQVVYYAKNIAATPGRNKVTVTFNGPRLGIDVRIAEYTGLDPNNPVDAWSSNSGSSNHATSGPVTTKTSNTLLVAFGISSGVMGKAEDPFITRVVTQPKMGGLANTGTGILADRTVNSVNNYEATAPMRGGGMWLMQLVALRGVS